MAATISNGLGVVNTWAETRVGYEKVAFSLERMARASTVLFEYLNKQSLSGQFDVLAKGLGNFQMGLNGLNLFKDMRKLTKGEYFAVTGAWQDKTFAYGRKVLETIANVGVPFKLLENMGTFKVGGVPGDVLVLVHSYAMLALNTLDIAYQTYALCTKQKDAHWSHLVNAVLKTATLATERFVPAHLAVVPAAVGLVAAGFDLFMFHRGGLKAVIDSLGEETKGSPPPPAEPEAGAQPPAAEVA